MTHRRNGKPIHGDKLGPSDPDYRGLTEEVEQQFLTVCELWGRNTNGAPFAIPKEMQQHFIRWRVLLLRHRKGDFRNSPSEWASTKEVAQFVFDWHCRLRGQQLKQLQWVD